MPACESVESAVRRAHPALVDEAVRSVSFLMCSEAAARARHAPVDDDDATVAARARRTKLIFTDDKDAEKIWQPGDARTATDEFERARRRRGAAQRP